MMKMKNHKIIVLVLLCIIVMGVAYFAVMKNRPHLISINQPLGVQEANNIHSENVDKQKSLNRGVPVKLVFSDIYAPIREVRPATDEQYWNRCLSTRLRNCFHDNGQLAIKIFDGGNMAIIGQSSSTLVEFKVGNFGIDFDGGGTWIDNNYLPSNSNEAKVLKVHEGYPFYSYKEIYFCSGKIFYPGEDIVPTVLGAKCLNAVELPGAIMLYSDLNEISMADRENTTEIVQSVKDYVRARADYMAKNHGEEPVLK